jgi:hypothetical protein
VGCTAGCREAGQPTRLPAAEATAAKQQPGSKLAGGSVQHPSALAGPACGAVGQATVSSAGRWCTHPPGTLVCSPGRCARAALSCSRWGLPAGRGRRGAGQGAGQRAVRGGQVHRGQGAVRRKGAGRESTRGQGEGPRTAQLKQQVGHCSGSLVGSQLPQCPGRQHPAAQGPTIPAHPPTSILACVRTSSMGRTTAHTILNTAGGQAGRHMGRQAGRQLWRI